jgi:hypothetical protein
MNRPVFFSVLMYANDSINRTRQAI